MLHTGVNEEVTVSVSAASTALVYDLQIGNGTDAADRLSLNLPIVNVDVLGFTGTDLRAGNNAEAVRDVIRQAAERLSLFQAEMGSQMNRLEVAGNHIQTTIENDEAARSTLLDVDVAAEMTTLAVQQVLLEASTAMLSEANAQPERLLQLIR